ncbi:MAG: oligosaccharide flippase family protein [Candidatus Omnitrophica bacterium]|nr:oligosaccharide flippase family protein [Candidatus Omnitrophota bacterium]
MWQELVVNVKDKLNFYLENMKIDGLLKDTGIVFVASSIVNVLNLLYQFFMVRMIAPTDFRILDTVLSLTMIATMPTGVLQTLVTKFVSGFKANNEIEKISSFLLLFLKKMGIFGIIIFSVFFVFRHNIASFYKIEKSVMIVVAGLIMLFSALFPLTLGGLQGLQKFKSLGMVNIINAGFKLLAGFVLVGLGFKIWGALMAIIIATVIAFFASLFPLKPYLFVPGRKFSSWKIEGVYLWSIYKFAFPIFAATASYALLTNMDIHLVMRFFSETDAGYYAVARMVGKIILFLPGAVTIVMFPKVSEQHAKNEDTIHVLKRSLVIVGLTCFLASVFCVLFPRLIINLLTGNV